MSEEWRRGGHERQVQAGSLTLFCKCRRMNNSPKTGLRPAIAPFWITIVYKRAGPLNKKLAVLSRLLPSLAGVSLSTKGPWMPYSFYLVSYLLVTDISRPLLLAPLWRSDFGLPQGPGNSSLFQ